MGFEKQLMRLCIPKVLPVLHTSLCSNTKIPVKRITEWKRLRGHRPDKYAWSAGPVTDFFFTLRI